MSILKENSNIGIKYIIKDNNKTIGELLLWNNNGEMTISNFDIKKKYRNKGYGTKLLSYVIEQIDDYCVLCVSENNIRALKLYYKFGFKYTQTEKTNKENMLWLIYERR